MCTATCISVVCTPKRILSAGYISCNLIYSCDTKFTLGYIMCAQFNWIGRILTISISDFKMLFTILSSWQNLKNVARLCALGPA